MKLIDRYIGRQLLLSAFFAVIVLSVVLVMGSIFKHILSKLVDRPDLDLGFIAELILNILPFSLAITIPWGFLTAILLVFGRLSADNELTSLRIAGLSMTRICLSVGLITLLFTGLCAWIKLRVEPDSRARIESLLPDMLYNLAATNPIGLFTDRQVMSEIPGYIIFAQRDGETLTQFEMVKLDRFSRPEMFVTAERVRVALDPDADEPTMLMNFHNAYFELKSGDADLVSTQPYAAEHSSMPIPLTALRKTRDESKPETLRVSQILELLGDDALKPGQRSSLRTELSTRFSFSMACVTLGLIGIPFAITAQRRETSVGFAMSLLIGIVYFLLMTLVDMLREKPDLHPEILAWIPNVIFILIGVAMFRRLARK
jgi:lipopolysaccharide export LptBFGC system permease protein LptF